MKELSLEIINNNKDIHWHHKKRKKSSTGRHFQNYYEITLILGGSAINVTTNTSQIIKANDIILMNKNIVHEIVSLEESNNFTSLKYINLAFSDYIMDKIQYIFSNFTLNQEITLKHLSDNATNKLVNLYNEININDSHIEAQIDIELFLYHMIKELLCNNNKAIQMYPNWFKNIIDKCQNTDKVQKTSDIFNISPYSKQYTIKKFQEFLNMTPSEYLNNKKIEQSIQLLINTDFSITDICYKIGFNNLEYFDRVFKKKMNLTPFRYRKVYKKLRGENKKI